MNPYKTPEDATCDKCGGRKKPRFSVEWILFIAMLVSMVCAWSAARTADANAKRAESYLDAWEEAMDREDHVWERLAEQQQLNRELERMLP